MTARSPFIKARNRWRRELSARLARRPALLRSDRPIVSFTFDDFPASAFEVAGAMLYQRGLFGTYYAALGLMGTDAPTGRIFGPELLQPLLDQGHELGCHTHSHCHAWDTDPATFAQSLLDNRSALEKHALDRAAFRTFSYPISGPRPENKRIAGRHFAACRGGGQTFNHGITDLNFLSAFFLEQSRSDFGAVRRLVAANRDARGWLIFATHDVAAAPTRFGVTPGFFADTLKCAIDSGALILPVAAALDHLWPGAFPRPAIVRQNQHGVAQIQPG